MSDCSVQFNRKRTKHKNKTALIFPKVWHPLTTASLEELPRFGVTTRGTGFAEMPKRADLPEGPLSFTELRGRGFSNVCFSVSSTLPAKICYLSFTFIAQFTVSIATPLRIQLFHSKRGREVAGKEVSLYNATPGRKLLLELSWLTSTALLKPKQRVTSPWDSPGAASGKRNHRRIFFPPGFMNK